MFKRHLPPEVVQAIVKEYHDELGLIRDVRIQLQQQLTRLMPLIDELKQDESTLRDAIVAITAELAGFQTQAQALKDQIAAGASQDQLQELATAFHKDIVDAQALIPALGSTATPAAVSQGSTGNLKGNDIGIPKGATDQNPNGASTTDPTVESATVTAGTSSTEAGTGLGQ